MSERGEFFFQIIFSLYVSGPCDVCGVICNTIVLVLHDNKPTNESHFNA